MPPPKADVQTIPMNTVEIERLRAFEAQAESMAALLRECRAIIQPMYCAAQETRPSPVQARRLVRLIDEATIEGKFPTVDDAIRQMGATRCRQRHWLGELRAQRDVLAKAFQAEVFGEGTYSLAEARACGEAVKDWRKLTANEAPLPTTTRDKAKGATNAE